MVTPLPHPPRWIPWLDLGIGVAVASFGIWRATSAAYQDPTMPVLIALLMGVAAGLFRAAPAAGLAVVWVSGAAQMISGLDIALVQLAATLVAFGAARYGRRITVVLSGVSIPLGAIAVLLYASSYGLWAIREFGGPQLLKMTGADLAGATMLGAGFLLATALLAGPWGLGLTLRLRAQSKAATAAREHAEHETSRAQELATLRGEQAKLARDVHDVVGHSLAVIIAQADSVQSLPDGEVGRIRAALENIAESARNSLADVRHVLGDGADRAEPRLADLDSLIDGVRGAGTAVESVVEGEPRPLPPERALVAYRTLQEMLTNALKHGGGGIAAATEWSADELRISVRNRAVEGVDPVDAGSGIPGMRDRLASVGGRLETGIEQSTFSAVAVLPLRSEGGV